MGKFYQKLSFLFVTYGLVIVIINAVLLALLGLLFPSLNFTTGLAGLVVGSAVLAFFGLLLEHIEGVKITDLAATGAAEAEITARLLMIGASIVELASTIMREPVVEQVTPEKVTRVVTQQVTLSLRETIQRMPTLQA